MKPASSIKFLLPAFLLIGAGLPFTSYAGPVCEDGTIDPPEETCDLTMAAACDGANVCRGNESDDPCTCCGDGIVQDTSGEQCDPEGETLPTETCSESCQNITPPTTVAPTTVAPTTVAPTTVAPTTVTPTTVAPTTVAPTTVAPTTVAPTTVAPTTVPPGQCLGMIEIDERNCRVSDRQVDGQCLSDAIAGCEVGGNHGKGYVRCVARDVTLPLMKSGVLTPKERRLIVRCAAKSDIGKRNTDN